MKPNSSISLKSWFQAIDFLKCPIPNLRLPQIPDPSTPTSKELHQPGASAADYYVHPSTEAWQNMNFDHCRFTTPRSSSTAARSLVIVLLEGAASALV